MSRKTNTRKTLPAVAALLAAGALASAAVASSVAAAPIPAAAAAAVSAPEVFAGFNNSKSMVGLAARTITLAAPIGTYAITAKTSVLNNNASTVDVKCRLQMGANFDESQATVSASIRRQSLALQVTNVANTPTNITLTCNNNIAGGNTTLTFMKITALRVQDPAHLHNVQLP